MTDKAIVLPSNMPVGYRFYPTEDEVIGYYLRLKIQGMNSEVDSVIAEVDICKWDPWDLPCQSKIKSKDLVWWFFSIRENKYPKSKRSNRKTKTGQWKITGTEIKIKGRATEGFNGAKRVLVFHECSTPGKGTGWVMHEYYHVPDNALSSERAYVVCRLEYKPDEKGQKAGLPDFVKGEPSGEIMPDLENPVASATISLGHGHDRVNPVSFRPDGIQAPSEVDESKECRTKLASSLVFDPKENNEGLINSDTHNEGLNEQGLGQNEVNPDYSLPPLDSPYFSDLEEVLASVGPDKSKESLTISDRSHILDGPVSIDTDNGVSEQRANVVCGMEFKPDEKGQKAGTPDYEKGETSGNITRDLESLVGSVAFPMGHSHNEVSLEYPLIQPESLDFCYACEMQATIGIYEFEDRLTEKLANLPTFDFEGNNCEATIDNLFDYSDQSASSKRSYPFSSVKDNGGVSKRGKR